LCSIARSGIVSGNTGLTYWVQSTGCVRWMLWYKHQFHLQASWVEECFVPFCDDERHAGIALGV
jgi:hypothetical protein